jgi:integrase
MARRQKPYWAWTGAEWCFSAHINSSLFQESPRFPSDCRQHFVAAGYLLCGFRQFHQLGAFRQTSFINKVFDATTLEAVAEPILTTLLQWGYKPTQLQLHLPRALAVVLLFNRSPFLEEITDSILESLYYREWLPAHLRNPIRLISRVLVEQGIIQNAIKPDSSVDQRYGERGNTGGIADEWLTWCQKWRATATLAPRSRVAVYHNLLKAGHWLARDHPEITHPQQWTRELAAEYVAAVDRMTVGEFGPGGNIHPSRIGKPLTPRTKGHHLSAMRTFFRDCHNWGWITPRFDPRRSLATPRAIQALIAPNPRVISDDVWAKLLWAGLNLTEDDLPDVTFSEGATLPRQRSSWYPLEMMKALVLVWLFSGLRADEICRLRVGCVRWQYKNENVPEKDTTPKDAICLLDVPTHKTGTAYTKPVDRILGEAIQVWEQVRPCQPPVVDVKTSEVIHYLFFYRGRKVGRGYINQTIIPMLCRKAGVPREDVRGPITSHRARSTIASQLFNAKEPLSLFELQEWLGHRSPTSTQHYARITPTKLSKAYQDAGYFERNTRTISVLLDQEAVKSGAAALGEPWRFYDLGHGYCTYDFFDQCPHRMACAKCAFYCPKDSSRAQLLEAKSNLQHLLQEIPLTDDEQAAVEDGLTAIAKLSEQLLDVPTPAGPTPRQLAAEKGLIIPLLPAAREGTAGKG